MGEIKSVKVDNWGVFFLQKLQNFFNKTDYCDLTLQFRDNSQLKVHRLVLSACTDYFNVLEQTCDVVDDALIMPNELQADVVVPIVNFMYTGTLEFELKMYGKLLRTAKEMNMTVLLKLLEAHRRTMEGVNRAQRPPSPKPIRRRYGTTLASGSPVTTSQQMTPLQQPRRILTTANAGAQQVRRIVQTKTIGTGGATTSATQQVQFRQQIGSTSVLKTLPGVSSSQIKAQYGNITVYENTPVMKDEPIDDYEQPKMQQQSTSPFEQLRKGYNNNKRPASATFISPPAKKPNIEDVKEFAEQQRMRKQIAAEYGEDQALGDYEGMLDDDIHNDDDDDDATVGTSSSAAASVQASTSRQQQVQQGATTITFKHEQNDKPPTIVVKDSSNSKMNHAKIISEVLRQYPHLVKSNKNIKLKIMPNVGGQTQKIIVKKEQLDNMSAEAAGGAAQQAPQKPLIISSQTLLKPLEKSQQSVLATKSAAIQKNITTAPAAATAASATATEAPAQKRRIDSKTMHALIAQGAENTTGPWLCLRCGVNGRPISIPSYRGFRRHLINTHKETIDAALCEHCGWRSNTNRELHFHMQVEHKVKTTLYSFPECLMCAELFLDTNALNQHMIDSHPDENKQQCIYCNKIFAREMQLYKHMKTYHKKQALEDGIIDYSDDEMIGAQDEAELAQHIKKESKIKILSDICLPSAGSMIKLEPSSEAVALSTVASGIATSIGVASAVGADELMDTSGGGEPKFVNMDGNEMELSDEQRKQIMSQLNQEHSAGGVVMVLNEASGFAAETNASLHEEEEDVQAQHESVESAEHEETGTAGEETSDFDDSQIFRELNKQATATDSAVEAEEETAAAVAGTADDKKGTSANLEESKESIDNLEWAENLISAHEMADEASKETAEKAKRDDDISKKLKELTGDWSEDENDDEAEAEEQAENAASVEAAVDTAKTADKEEATKEEAEAKMEASVEKEKELEAEKETEEDEEEPVEQSKMDVDEEKPADTNVADDDIEMAMKSMHKDGEDDSQAEVATEEKAEIAVAEPTTTTTAEVEKETETAQAVEDVELKEADAKVKEITEREEDKQEKDEKAEEEEKEEKTTTSRSLIAELIADAVKIEEEEIDDDEFITVTPEKKVEKKTLVAETEVEPEKKKEAEVVAAEKTADTEIAAEDSTTATTEDVAIAEDPEKSVEKDAAVDETSAAAATTTTVTTTATTTSSETDGAANIAAETSTKPSDKVKSLISEWVDDEDDDEANDGNEEEL